MASKQKAAAAITVQAEATFRNLKRYAAADQLKLLRLQVFQRELHGSGDPQQQGDRRAR